MLSKKLLLINPWAYDFSAYDFWLKPYGLLLLADYLEKNNFKINFVDCLYEEKIPPTKSKEKFGCGKISATVIKKPAVLSHIPRKFKRYGISTDNFIKAIKKEKNYQAIFITSLFTYWYPGVLEVINICKEIFPQVPVFVGGIYATLCYEHCLKNSSADFIIKNGEEKNILKLLRVKNFVPFVFKNCFPAYHNYQKLNYICLLYLRGCPYCCSYCAASSLHPQIQYADEEILIKKIKYYANKGIKNFAFYDDALLVNSHKAKNLFSKIANLKLKINFHSPNGLHAKHIDKEVATLLKKIGFKTLRLGLETANENFQKKTGNKVNNQQFINAVKNLKNAGFENSEIGVYLLMGMPEQTISEVKESIDFVASLKVLPFVSEYSPIPDTTLGKKASSEFKINPATDPLLQNCSVLSYQSKIFNEEVVNMLKLKAKTLREKIINEKN